MGLETFAERLNWARRAAGMSRRALSVKAGLAEPHVGMIERNLEADPQGSTAAALAEALGVSIEWLVTGRGEPPAMPATPATTGTDG